MSLCYLSSLCLEFQTRSVLLFAVNKVFGLSFRHVASISGILFKQQFLYLECFSSIKRRSEECQKRWMYLLQLLGFSCLHLNTKRSAPHARPCLFPHLNPETIPFSKRMSIFMPSPIKPNLVYAKEKNEDVEGWTWWVGLRVNWCADTYFPSLCLPAHGELWPICGALVSIYLTCHIHRRAEKHFHPSSHAEDCKHKYLWLWSPFFPILGTKSESIFGSRARTLIQV
jgi:hypothetical protein